MGVLMDWINEQPEGDRQFWQLLSGPVGSQAAAERTEAEAQDLIAGLDTKNPEINLGTGYADQAARLNNYRYSAPGMTSANDSAGYITDLNKALGIGGPVDARNAQRESVGRALDNQAYEQSIRDQGNLARTGNTDSGASLALGALTRNDLAGQRADTFARIDQDYADRQAAFDAQNRAAALGYGARADQYGMNAAQFDFQQQQAAINNALGLQDFDTKRQLTEYEYNDLMPFQAQVARDLAQAQALQQDAGNQMANRGQRIGMIGGMMGGMFGGGGGGQTQQFNAMGQQNYNLQNPWGQSGNSSSSPMSLWGS